MNMKKGDIVKGKNNIQDNGKFGHPIIFLSENDSDTFIGAMLTSSNQFTENILMKSEHFKTGSQWTFNPNNAHLVSSGPFIKKMEWRPFRKVGELSDTGIAFVESHLSRKYPVLFSLRKQGEE